MAATARAEPAGVEAALRAELAAARRELAELRAVRAAETDELLRMKDLWRRVVSALRDENVALQAALRDARREGARVAGAPLPSAHSSPSAAPAWPGVGGGVAWAKRDSRSPPSAALAAVVASSARWAQQPALPLPTPPRRAAPAAPAAPAASGT
jgi:hypothetical protein